MSAIYLNNKGVISFEEGRLDDALMMFRNALSESRALLPINRKQSLNLQANILQDLSISSPKIHKNQEGSLIEYVYLSPINIPQDNDPATGGVVGCIIMFNMAMACHAKGLSANQSKSSSWLTKAKKIYALSYGLTESEGMETVHNFLVPSILNNIGMVEKRLNPFSNEASKEYFEHLLAFLVLWQGTHTLSPQRLEGCLSNMIVELNILSGPITAPVA